MIDQKCLYKGEKKKDKQESRAAAREPRDAASVLFG